MKQWILGIGCLLVVMVALAEEQVFRAFTAKDGRTLEARIVDNLPAKGQVQIERRNGKKIWVKPDIFSEAGQVYIREWMAADLFLSESMFRISVEEYISSGDVGIVHYVVSLDNRSNISFSHLKLDYQIHVGKKTYTGGRGHLRHVDGQANVKSLPAGSKKKLWTKGEKLVTTFNQSYEYTDPNTGEDRSNGKFKTSKEEVEGVLIRFQGPTVDDVPTIRELSYPSGFGEKVEWFELSLGEKREKAQKLSYDVLIEKAEDCHYGKDGETNYVKAIEFYEQALEVDPEKAVEIGRKIAYVRLAVCTQPQIELAEKWAEENESDGTYVELALFFGCRAPAEFLNGRKAVQYAQKAGQKSWYTEEALAIACARNGQFDRAVDIQRDVIKSLKRVKNYSDARLDRYKFQYQLYKENKAYTEGMENEVQ